MKDRLLILGALALFGGDYVLRRCIRRGLERPLLPAWLRNRLGF